jgi:hypothetical protein
MYLTIAVSSMGSSFRDRALSTLWRAWLALLDLGKTSSMLRSTQLDWPSQDQAIVDAFTATRSAFGSLSRNPSNPSWCGALGFRQRFELGPREDGPNPRDQCSELPCLFCLSGLRIRAGSPLQLRCLPTTPARGWRGMPGDRMFRPPGLPDAPEKRSSPEQAAFHMRAVMSRLG